MRDLQALRKSLEEHPTHWSLDSENLMQHDASDLWFEAHWFWPATSEGLKINVVEGVFLYFAVRKWRQSITQPDEP